MLQSPGVWQPAFEIHAAGFGEVGPEAVAALITDAAKAVKSTAN